MALIQEKEGIWNDTESENDMIWQFFIDVLKVIVCGVILILGWFGIFDRKKKNGKSKSSKSKRSHR